MWSEPAGLERGSGDTQESVKPETRTRTRHREIPLIDLAHAVAATVSQAIAPILPASGATAPDDGTCGNGGSLATCIQEPDQPPTPGTPTTPDPAPQPGNAGAGGPIPPSSGLSSDHCDPDDPDGNSDANNPNAAKALSSKLSALENAQSSAEVARELPDGRIRYYGPETPARTTGPTRGASYVTEWDPGSGLVRSWMESYGQSGEVLRTHPKMLNGQQLNAPHFPPLPGEC